jgi:hypothetical protein
MEQYSSFVGEDLDHYFDAYQNAETIKEQNKALDKIMMDMTRYVKYLRTVEIVVKSQKRKGYSSMSIQTKTGCLRGLFKYNHVVLPSTFWKQMKVKGQVVTQDRIPSKDELRRIVSHLDVMLRAYVFIKTSTGMRIEDLLALPVPIAQNIGKNAQKVIPSIDFTTTPTRVHYYQHKISQWTYGFLTKEGTLAVQEWLKVRDAEITSIQKNAYKIRVKKYKHLSFEEFCALRNDKDKLFPAGMSTLRRRYNEALDKAELGERDGNTNVRVLHDHTMRKFSKTMFGLVCSEAVSDALIGHTEGVSSLKRTYNKQSDMIDYLAQEFLRAEQNISLTTEVLPTKELEQVNQRLEMNEAKLESKDQKIDNIQKANEDYFQIVQMLLEKIDTLQEEIDTRNKAIIDQVEYQWQDKINREHPKPDANKFKQGADIIIANMVAMGRPQSEIEAYKRSIEHRMKFF